MVHIRQKHTLDLILLEGMTIMQWFNPFIWMYRRSLKGIHEYLADEGVILKGTGISAYQKMLLDQVMGIQLNDLTNNFNQSLLKRRFIMMNRRKSGFTVLLKPLLALPVIFLVMMIFSLSGRNNALGQDPPPQPNSKDSPLPPADKNLDDSKSVTSSGQEETDYLAVSQKPEFKGGEVEFIKYILENVKYPEDAKKKGITGKVYVQYVVDETGKSCNDLTYSVFPRRKVL
jgi:hypothetical protein